MHLLQCQKQSTKNKSYWCWEKTRLLNLHKAITEASWRGWGFDSTFQDGNIWDVWKGKKGRDYSKRGRCVGLKNKFSLNKTFPWGEVGKQAWRRLGSDSWPWMAAQDFEHCDCGPNRKKKWAPEAAEAEAMGVGAGEGTWRLLAAEAAPVWGGLPFSGRQTQTGNRKGSEAQADLSDHCTASWKCLKKEWRKKSAKDFGVHSWWPLRGRCWV